MIHKFILTIVTEWQVDTNAAQTEIEKAKKNVIEILHRETPEFASFAKRTRISIEELKT